MGIIRKAASITTLGIINFRSKAERLERTESELNQATDLGELAADDRDRIQKKLDKASRKSEKAQRRAEKAEKKAKTERRRASRTSIKSVQEASDAAVVATRRARRKAKRAAKKANKQASKIVSDATDHLNV